MNFTKIHNIIWSVIGVLISFGILMGVLFVGVSIFNIVRYRPGGIAVEETKDEGKLKLKTVYEMPLLIEGSDYFVVPVSLKKVEESGERVSQATGRFDYAEFGSYSKSGYLGYHHFTGPCHNLVFIHKKTGAASLLFNEKVYIDSVYFPEKRYEDPEKSRPTFILLELGKADTNHDKILNGKDALEGYVVNLDGTALTQVTPSGTTMRWWSYDEASKRLFVEIVEDSNQDHKFTNADQIKTVGIDMNLPGIGKEPVPAEIKERIEKIV